MDTNKAKENILKRIRKGLQRAQIKEFDVPTLSNNELFATPDKLLPHLFQEELTKVNGQFFYCNNNQDLIEQLNELHHQQKLGLCYSPDKQFEEIIGKTTIPFTTAFQDREKIKCGISSCEYLIARYGSVMVSSAQPGARRIFSFPEVHIVIAYENQLVLEIEEALQGIRNKYGEDLPSQITNITGPSRTADIEKTLILGAHGPKQLIVFVLKP